MTLNDARAQVRARFGPDWDADEWVEDGDTLIAVGKMVQEGDETIMHVFGPNVGNSYAAWAEAMDTAATRYEEHTRAKA